MKVLIDRRRAAIAALLKEMDMDLAVLEQRPATTRALQQGMMQKLLTSRTRRSGPSAATP
ncbi:MAG: hypothetical protein WCP53_01265 [Verrucomicrobiota bacterium]